MINQIDALQKELDSNQAALIYTPVNRKYLTGFQSSLGYLFVTNEKAVLFLDGRYYLAATQIVKNAKLVLLSKFSDQLCQLVKQENVGTILLENEISIGTANRFKSILPDTQFVTDGSLSERLTSYRSIKDEEEIECIKAAQRIAEKAFIEVLNFVRVGVTEKRLAAELEYKMAIFGSQRPAFETIAISGSRTAMPHGVPTDKEIEKGDFVTFDFGAVIDGYCSDMTRTVAVGFATDEMQKVYNTVLEANIAVEKEIRPNMTCKEADLIARQVIEKAGYKDNFTHSTGHSLGLEIHESPSLSPNSDEILRVGNIVTDEPGIYLDGKFGVRIEDMLLITEQGADNLTLCDKKLIIV